MLLCRLQVGCLHIAFEYLFVGYKVPSGDGLIKIWNRQTGTSHTLPGHNGQVQRLAIANNCLFSGGQDGSIRIWTFNSDAKIFTFGGMWTAEQGNGHRSAVSALHASGAFMFSGDYCCCSRAQPCTRVACSSRRLMLC